MLVCVCVCRLGEVFYTHAHKNLGKVESPISLVCTFWSVNNHRGKGENT